MSAWPWPSSETTGKVIPAFVAALQGVDDVTRNKKASLELKSGSKVNYTYADLDVVLEQVKPVLTTNGLAITTPPTSNGVYTVLMHTSGEWVSFPALEFKPTQATPQGQGSALSYGRRYAVLGVLNIATEDDDGKAASQAPKSIPLASSTQLRSLGTLLRERVGTDRDAGLALIAEISGRTVNSSKELTTAEASRVIAALQTDAADEPEAVAS